MFHENDDMNYNLLLIDVQNILELIFIIFKLLGAIYFFLVNIYGDKGFDGHVIDLEKIKNIF